MNMLDYLGWMGNVSFREKELNEVDNLIFSTIVYLKMEDLISADGSRTETIGELYKKCEELGTDTSHYACDPMKALKAAASSARFKDVRVKWYVSRFDTSRHMQFAAVTFVYDDEKAYVAFRGTDSTLTGWREDYYFCCQTETTGQKEAVQYLNLVAKLMKGTFIVGGHSKGGNFAAYGSAFCDRQVRDSRITRIYSNDGPGFNSKIADSPEYRAILGKLIKIIPEFSIVGIMLSSRARRKVITSSARGKYQHDPYTWNVKGTEFETADGRSIASFLLDGAISSWIAALSARDKQRLIDALFDLLEATGADTLQEVKEQKLASFIAMLKAAAGMDLRKKGEIALSLGRVISAGKDRIISGAVKGVDKYIVSVRISILIKLTGGNMDSDRGLLTVKNKTEDKPECPED